MFRPETVPARLAAVSTVVAPVLVIDPAIVDVPVLAIVTDPVLAPEGAVVAHVAATTAAAAEIATGAIAVVETTPQHLQGLFVTMFMQFQLLEGSRSDPDEQLLIVAQVSLAFKIGLLATRLFSFNTDIFPSQF